MGFIETSALNVINIDMVFNTISEDKILINYKEKQNDVDELKVRKSFIMQKIPLEKVDKIEKKCCIPK